MKIGFTEIMVILVVALLVLGPDKLPYYAKKLGEGLREFHKVSSEATKDIRESVIEPLEEAQRPLKEAMEPFTEWEKDVRRDVEEIKSSLTDLGKVDLKGPGPGAETAEGRQDPPSTAQPSETAASPAEEPERKPEEKK